MATKKDETELKTVNSGIQTLSLFEKLSNIQISLKAPKELYNDYGKYHYRNAEGILEAVKPYLAQFNLFLTINDELVQIGDRYYIKATAKLIECATGESITTVAYAREEVDKKGMDGSQITGSTSSYARKYALNGLFLLDDSKDADSDESPANVKATQKKPTLEQVKNEISDLWKKAGGPEEGFDDYFNSKTNNGTDLSEKAVAVMRASLLDMIKKKTEEKKHE